MARFFVAGVVSGLLLTIDDRIRCQFATSDVVRDTYAYDFRSGNISSKGRKIMTM